MVVNSHLPLFVSVVTEPTKPSPAGAPLAITQSPPQQSVSLLPGLPTNIPVSVAPPAWFLEAQQMHSKPLAVVYYNSLEQAQTGLLDVSQKLNDLRDFIPTTKEESTLKNIYIHRLLEQLQQTIQSITCFDFTYSFDPEIIELFQLEPDFIEQKLEVSLKNNKNLDKPIAWLEKNGLSRSDIALFLVLGIPQKCVQQILETALTRPAASLYHAQKEYKQAYAESIKLLNCRKTLLQMQTGPQNSKDSLKNEHPSDVLNGSIQKISLLIKSLAKNNAQNEKNVIDYTILCAKNNQARAARKEHRGDLKKAAYYAQKSEEQYARVAQLYRKKENRLKNNPKKALKAARYAIQAGQIALLASLSEEQKQRAKMPNQLLHPESLTHLKQAQEDLKRAEQYPVRNTDPRHQRLVIDLHITNAKIANQKAQLAEKFVHTARSFNKEQVSQKNIQAVDIARRTAEIEAFNALDLAAQQIETISEPSLEMQQRYQETVTQRQQLGQKILTEEIQIERHIHSQQAALTQRQEDASQRLEDTPSQEELNHAQAAVAEKQNELASIYTLDKQSKQIELQIAYARLQILQKKADFSTQWSNKNTPPSEQDLAQHQLELATYQRTLKQKELEDIRNNHNCSEPSKQTKNKIELAQLELKEAEKQTTWAQQRLDSTPAQKTDEFSQEHLYQIEVLSQKLLKQSKDTAQYIDKHSFAEPVKSTLFAHVIHGQIANAHLLTDIEHLYQTTNNHQKSIQEQQKNRFKQHPTNIQTNAQEQQNKQEEIEQSTQQITYYRAKKEQQVQDLLLRVQSFVNAVHHTQENTALHAYFLGQEASLLALLGQPEQARQALQQAQNQINQIASKTYKTKAQFTLVVHAHETEEETRRFVRQGQTQSIFKNSNHTSESSIRYSQLVALYTQVNQIHKEAANQYQAIGTKDQELTQIYQTQIAPRIKQQDEHLKQTQALFYQLKESQKERQKTAQEELRRQELTLHVVTGDTIHPIINFLGYGGVIEQGESVLSPEIRHSTGQTITDNMQTAHENIASQAQKNLNALFSKQSTALDQVIEQNHSLSTTEEKQAHADILLGTLKQSSKNTQSNATTPLVLDLPLDQKHTDTLGNHLKTLGQDPIFNLDLSHPQAIERIKHFEEQTQSVQESTQVFKADIQWWQSNQKTLIITQEFSLLLASLSLPGVGVGLVSLETAVIGAKVTTFLQKALQVRGIFLSAKELATLSLTIKTALGIGHTYITIKAQDFITQALTPILGKNSAALAIVTNLIQMVKLGQMAGLAGAGKNAQTILQKIWQNVIPLSDFALQQLIIPNIENSNTRSLVQQLTHFMNLVGPSLQGALVTIKDAHERANEAAKQVTQDPNAQKFLAKELHAFFVVYKESLFTKIGKSEFDSALTRFVDNIEDYNKKQKQDKQIPKEAIDVFVKTQKLCYLVIKIQHTPDQSKEEELLFEEFYKFIQEKIKGQLHVEIFQSSLWIAQQTGLSHKKAIAFAEKSARLKYIAIINEQRKNEQESSLPELTADQEKQLQTRVESIYQTYPELRHVDSGQYEPTRARSINSKINEILSASLPDALKQRLVKEFISIIAMVDAKRSVYDKEQVSYVQPIVIANKLAVLSASHPLLTPKAQREIQDVYTKTSIETEITARLEQQNIAPDIIASIIKDISPETIPTNQKFLDYLRSKPNNINNDNALNLSQNPPSHASPTQIKAEQEAGLSRTGMTGSAKSKSTIKPRLLEFHTNITSDDGQHTYNLSPKELKAMASKEALAMLSRIEKNNKETCHESDIKLAAESKNTARHLQARIRVLTYYYKTQLGFGRDRDHTRGIEFLLGHILGTNLEKPVRLLGIPAGTVLAQFQFPNRPIGNYFSVIDANPRFLGIESEGRITHYYITQQPMLSLVSETKMAADTWSKKNAKSICLAGEPQIVLDTAKAALFFKEINGNEATQQNTDQHRFYQKIRGLFPHQQDPSNTQNHNESKDHPPFPDKKQTQHTSNQPAWITTEPTLQPM